MLDYLLLSSGNTCLIVWVLVCAVQAVFELPARIQAALEEDALDSAVSFYAEALPVLRKYGHKGAFRGVAAQAEAAGKQISMALKRRLAERKDETEHMVLLLRQLGEGDDSLQVRLTQACAVTGAAAAPQYAHVCF